jgi:hypothetical protein
MKTDATSRTADNHFCFLVGGEAQVSTQQPSGVHLRIFVRLESGQDSGAGFYSLSDPHALDPIHRS